MAVRDRLVNSAITLMRRTGVAGTGITELIQEAHTARRSVYLNFPGGKAELLAEATVVAGRFITDAIATLTSNYSPAEALSTYADQWRRSLSRSGFEAGCPIMAAALGRFQAPGAADAAGVIFSEWGSLLSDRLQDAGVDPYRASDLAHTAIATIEGAVLMCVASQSTEPLSQAERVLKQLLESAVETSGS